MNIPSTASRAGRNNGLIFIWCQLLIYFSAPVIYVGVVQAAFCDKLGASATVANLPTSAALLGALLPIGCSWLFATRLEKHVLAASYWVAAISMLFVCAIVFFPCPKWLQLTVLIGQSFIVGVIANVSSIYAMTCLGRGTTEQERSRALKYAFGLGPFAAVLGSLTAQLVLDNRVPGLPYPYNFGALYLMAFPCMIVCAVLSRRFRLPEVPDEPRQPFGAYMRESLRAYRDDRKLMLTWFAYLFWYITIDATPNISLYAREVVGRDPIELAGIVMAVSFGCKAIAGFSIGSYGVRQGPQKMMNVTVILAGAALLWPLIPTGYGYIFAFGLMGAAELGGVYFPNYVVSISPGTTAARNLAIQSLVGPISSFAPPIYGALTDKLGFQSSFLFGALAAGISFALLMKLDRPARAQ